MNFDDLNVETLNDGLDVGGPTLVDNHGRNAYDIQSNLSGEGHLELATHADNADTDQDFLRGGGQQVTDTQWPVALVPKKETQTENLRNGEDHEHCDIHDVPVLPKISDGCGHTSSEHLVMTAAPSDILESKDHGQAFDVVHGKFAVLQGVEVGQYVVDSHRTHAHLNPVCDRLRELHRQRQDLHRAEKSLTLQIKAKCRRLCKGSKPDAAKLYALMFKKSKKKSEDEGQQTFDTQVNGAEFSDSNSDQDDLDTHHDDVAEFKGGGQCLVDTPLKVAPSLESLESLVAPALAISVPFIKARALVSAERKVFEKAMKKEAQSLPISAWVESTHGLGLLSLALIVGEAGNLANYATVSRLWKRMGLAVINGERQRKKKGKEEALAHGYNPSRRSVMWTIRDTVFKAQSARKDKKTEEIVREAGEYRLIYDARKAYELERDPEIKKKHAHRRAMRYMEKRIVRDFWRAWRSAPMIP